jgi:hypothetical protein
MRTLIDNDGNEVRTTSVYPRDVRPGDRKPRFRAINVGTIAERTVYEEEVVESVEKRRTQSGVMYRIVLIASNDMRRTANILAQSRFEIKERS